MQKNIESCRFKDGCYKCKNWMTKPFGKENVYEDKTFVIFYSCDFFGRMWRDWFNRARQCVERTDFHSNIIYNPTKYSKQKGDVFVKSSLPTTMAKQIPNACVTSIMEYANNKVFGGTVNEGAYILYYTQTYNSNPLIDGVSLDYIEPFVTHFFKTQTFTNYKSAIDAKHPVMTDVNSQIESSAHNVLCVGYNSNTGAAIYMDPELACMYSVNAGYFLQDYNIVLTGIK